MRICVVNQHYWPEVAATGQLLADVCEDLAAAGHDVTVITGQPSYRQIEGQPDRLPDREVHAGVRIRRVWSHVPARRSIAGRLSSYGTFFAAAVAELLRMEQPDIVVVLSTPPLLLGAAGLSLSRLRGVPFLYSVQDLYPDIAVELGVLQPGLLTNAIGAASNALYRSAAGIVTLSDDMARAIAGKGVSPDRITVIPNWSDTDDVRPLPKNNPIAIRLGLHESFVVLYSGNVGLSHGLEQLPAAAEEVKDLPVLFAVVGDGSARPELERQVLSRGLTNFRFFSPRPRADLAGLLSAADVGLVTMRMGVASSLVPSKLYGIMAAGRPVLASVERRSEVAKTVEAHACGVVTPAEDPKALATAIRGLFADRETRERMGARGRTACETSFSRRACTARYRSLIEATARSGGRLA